MSFLNKFKANMGIQEELEEVPKEAPQQEEVEEEEEEHAASSAKVKKIKVQRRTAKEEKLADPPSSEDRGESTDWFEPEGELAVDVYQTGNEVVIQSTIAGLKAEDLDVSIENDIVTILGERKNSLEYEEKDYLIQECYWGSFSRQIILPEEVDASKAEASIKDGVLIVRVPKIERVKVKKIQIRG